MFDRAIDALLEKKDNDNTFERDEAMEKEISHILDEAEAIINEPSESVERKEAQTLIRRAIEKE